MKIKGIDLYKRVLEEDETILGKIFEFDDMKIKVVNTFGSLSNAWGLAKDGGCEFHIFYKSSRKEIDEIFKAEWVEVRQAVSFMEAVKSGKRLRVEHELLTLWVSGDSDYLAIANIREIVEGQYRNLETLIGQIFCFSGDDDWSDIILNGKWYIED